MLLVKVNAPRIPQVNEEIIVDFDAGAEFADGAWGKEGATGMYQFTVTGHCLSPTEINGIPVVETQLAFDDLEEMTKN